MDVVGDRQIDATGAETVVVSRKMLEAAVRRWDEESKAEAWPTRDDDGRHGDNADYLFGLLVEMEAPVSTGA